VKICICFWLFLNERLFKSVYQVFLNHMTCYEQLLEMFYQKPKHTSGFQDSKMNKLLCKMKNGVDDHPQGELVKMLKWHES